MSYFSLRANFAIKICLKKKIIIIIIINKYTIKKGMVENIKRVSESANVTETQKISMLGSARIPRKVLNV